MNDEKILLDHGSGGKISHHLTTDLMLSNFDNPILAELNDSAVVELERQRLAFSTDSFTVDPIFFPGGNIGELAVNGTVNDVAMSGAAPLFLSVGFIIEEGFAMADLQTIVVSMREAAHTAGVQVVTGDTKVVPSGAADKIFINTSGIGRIPNHIHLYSSNAQPGDKVILSGYMADHGIAVMMAREDMHFETSIVSDTAPLNHLVKRILMASRKVHVLRDPTRGGVGTALNEIAVASGVGIRIEEIRLPIRDEVAGACDLLGFDPLYLANEGKLLAFVAPDHADMVLEVMRQNPYGHDACLIGEVVAEHAGQVFMQTPIGGERIVDMLTGEQLPRIC